jgi:hypothetical protein
MHSGEGMFGRVPASVLAAAGPAGAFLLYGIWQRIFSELHLEQH